MNHLALDAQLHFHLSRMKIGDTVLFQDWCITRAPSRFKLKGGDAQFDMPPCGGGVLNTDFARLRAISCIVALILGSAFAPELAYDNVTRSGPSFQAWHYHNDRETDRRGWRLAVTAASPDDAHLEYLAWKTHESNIWFNFSRSRRRA